MTRIANLSPTFGLPPCLLVAIAAKDIPTIESRVGHVLQDVRNQADHVVAVCVRSHPRKTPNNSRVPLWSHPGRAGFEERLFPDRQVWVHVDYDGYRAAYISFGMPAIPPGYFLDHVQNREAIRLRGYSHPYLRLCPVSRGVNTSGGHLAGGEGMEKDYLRQAGGSPSAKQTLQARVSSYDLVYADPMDLTKILNLRPGTGNLEGVRVTQQLFYPQ